MAECLICDFNDDRVRVGDQSGFAKIGDCPRCGRYGIEIGLSRHKIADSEMRLWCYLSAYTRQEAQRGNVAMITHETWRDYAQAHKNLSVSDKRRKLLELIESRSSFPGDYVDIDPFIDCFLISAVSEQEFRFHLGNLRDQDLLWLEGNVGSLSGKGWEHLEAFRIGSGIPGRCFVAMSFDPQMEPAFSRGIAPAVVEDCRLHTRIHLGKEQHNDQITDRIIAEIRKAQFVIADFTGQRGGVYFEAGFAFGLGRPVIYTCREDDKKNIHFDTRQFNYIFWSTPEELRVRLRDRIQATILNTR